MRKHVNWAMLFVAVLAPVAAAGVACGGGGSYEKSPTAVGSKVAPTAAPTKPAATPATTSAATAAATKPAATATQGAATPGGGEETTLTLIAKDTLWDKTELKAKPGAVTIQVDNQDVGIPHNVHVYKGEDNTGQDLGMTELEAGPIKQALTLQLTAGEHFFVCDVHPATMEGKLEIE